MNGSPTVRMSPLDEVNRLWREFLAKASQFVDVEASMATWSLSERALDLRARLVKRDSPDIIINQEGPK